MLITPQAIGRKSSLRLMKPRCLGSFKDTVETLVLVSLRRGQHTVIEFLISAHPKRCIQRSLVTPFSQMELKHTPLRHMIHFMICLQTRITQLIPVSSFLMAGFTGYLIAT